MDDFKKQTARTIGPGGMKCPCCNIFHTFGNHQRKKPGLSKLRRTRFKQQLRQEIEKGEEMNRNNKDEIMKLAKIGYNTYKKYLNRTVFCATRLPDWDFIPCTEVKAWYEVSKKMVDFK